MSSSWELKLCFVLRVANDTFPTFRGPMIQLWRETHTKEQHSWGLNNFQLSATLFLRQVKSGAPRRRLLERQGPVLDPGEQEHRQVKRETEWPSWRWNKPGLFMDCEEARLIRADHLCCVNIFKTGKICWSKYIFICKRYMIHFTLSLCNVSMIVASKIVLWLQASRWW